MRVKYGIHNIRNQWRGGTLQPHWHLIRQGKRGTETAPLKKHAACLEAGASARHGGPMRHLAYQFEWIHPIEDKHCVRLSVRETLDSGFTRSMNRQGNSSNKTSEQQ
jgi:hypothetical protein